MHFAKLWPRKARHESRNDSTPTRGTLKGEPSLAPPVLHALSSGRIARFGQAHAPLPLPLPWLDADLSGDSTYGGVGQRRHSLHELVPFPNEVPRLQLAPTTLPLIVRVFTGAPQFLQACRQRRVTGRTQRTTQPIVGIITRKASFDAMQIWRHTQLERDEDGVVCTAYSGSRPGVFTCCPGRIIVPRNCLCDKMIRYRQEGVEVFRRSHAFGRRR